jgi:lysophospholipase L1-like esterase
MSLSKRLLIAFLVLCALVGRSPAQIVAFGASNVAGAGVESGEAWPAQLEALLREKGLQRQRHQRGDYRRYDNAHARAS